MTNQDYAGQQMEQMGYASAMEQHPAFGRGVKLESSIRVDRSLSAKSPSPISVSLMSTDQRLEKLSELISDLLTQLEPVMTPEAPKMQTAIAGNGSDNYLSGGCHISHQIDAQEARISSMIARLTEARERLCV